MGGGEKAERRRLEKKLKLKKYMREGAKAAVALAPWELLLALLTYTTRFFSLSLSFYSTNPFSVF